MNFSELRYDCAAKGALFEDEDFPVESTSIAYSEPVPAGVGWRRPKELLPEPRFVIDDRSQFDIQPGSQSNVWLTSALGILYQYRGLFYRAVPADQGFQVQDFAYAGVFHFRFWWAGEWTEVVIDDRLPVQGKQLLFSHSKDSMQFWAALLEKAYAKQHGSYEGIRYASSIDIFNELTGGITDSFKVDEPQDKVLARIRSALTTTTILTGVTKPRLLSAQGLTPSRHYLIAGVEEVQTTAEKQTLVRMCPGLGSGAWTGSWSREKSPEWTSVPDHVKRQLSRRTPVQDEFWISWQDFLENFDRIEAVYLDADTCHSEKMLQDRKTFVPGSFQGSWQRGVTAGGCRNEIASFHLNHQVLLTTSKEEVLISLIQHQVAEPKVIGFSVYKVPSTHRALGPLESSFFRNNKAVFTSNYSNSRSIFGRLNLEPGNYAIIPTTFDTGTEGTFTLRVYGLASITLRELDHVPALLRAPILRAPSSSEDYYKEFMEYADERKVVNAFEMQEILHNTLPNDYVKSSATLEVCKKAVHALNPGLNYGRINYNHFQDFIYSLKLWQEIFNSYGKNVGGAMQAEHLRDALADAGFQLSIEILSLLMWRYMRRDGTLRFGDFVSAVLQLTCLFSLFSRKTKDVSDHMDLTLKDWAKSVLRC